LTFGASGCVGAQPPAPLHVNFAATARSATESAGTLALTLQIDPPPARRVEVALRFGGTATIDRDYDAPATVVFETGKKEATFDVTPRGDDERECTETAYIEVANSDGANKRMALTLEDETPAPRRLHVGAGQEFAGVDAASKVAQDGDIIEIAAGTYRGDVAVLRANDLVVCAAGSGARIDAAGKDAEGKGIWVIKGDRVRVENIEFAGAKVSDNNGAGIRAEGRDLTVRHSRFIRNENGILSGEQPDSTITIENSQFVRNGAGDGYSHNIYIGKAGRLVARFNIFREAEVGHELKTRARESLIEYNFIANGKDGNASMEVDFANGGLGVLLGNVIQQSPQAENSTMVAFGAEGMPYERNALLLVHNTIVNDRSFGVFARAPRDKTCVARNNVILGRGESQCGDWPKDTNVTLKSEVHDRAGFNYRLLGRSAALDAGQPVAARDGVDLTPRYEIDADGWVRKRVTRGAPDAGAYEAAE
jgi:hypothetical protein